MNSFIIFIRKIDYTFLRKDAICCVAVNQTIRGEGKFNIPYLILRMRFDLTIHYVRKLSLDPFLEQPSLTFTQLTLKRNINVLTSELYSQMFKELF